MKKYPKTILLALLGALAFNVVHAVSGAVISPAASAHLVLGQINPQKPVGNARVVVYFCIIFGGLLGGFIYSISQNQGFLLPKRYKDGDKKFFKLGLGTFADMLVGLGGGILIFLLVPYAGDADLITTLIEDMGTNTEASSLLKVIALALIGGFAGISLFDEAAKRIAHQVQQLEVVAENNRERINVITTAATREAEIQFLLSPLLDPTISSLKPKQVQELVEAIVAAPINIRNGVFSQVQSAVDQYWLMGQKGEHLSEADVKTYQGLFKQLILPFDALVQAAKKEYRETGNLDGYLHRYFAHIAFCQQQIATADEILGIGNEARSNWTLAEENLTEAIEHRNEIGDLEELFWHYELHRSLCYYKLNNQSRAAEELQAIKSTWLGKEPGVLASLLKNLDLKFLQLLETQLFSPELSDLLSALIHPQDTNGAVSEQGFRRNGRRRDSSEAERDSNQEAGEILENLNSQ